jgi:hypothetical protein
MLDPEPDMAELTMQRDAAERALASTQAQLEGLQRELRDAKEEACDAVRAFKAAMIVTAYLASLL